MKKLSILTRFAVFFLLFACTAAQLPAGGGKEKSAVIQVSGVVRLVGSAAFSELVISTPDMEWYIAKEDVFMLKNLQQKMVTVEGVETVETLRLANSFPAGEKRTLGKIKIISIQQNEDEQ